MSNAWLSDARRGVLYSATVERWLAVHGRQAALFASGVAAPIIVGVAAGHFSESPFAALWFVPPIFLVALWGGIAPAALTIFVSLAAFDYWVLPPRHSLVLTQVSDLWMALSLAPCAAFASILGIRLRRQLRAIHRHETRSDALRLLSHAVVSQHSTEAVYFAAANALSRAYEAPAVILVVGGGRLRMASGTRGAMVSEEDLRAADWALANNAPAGSAGGSRYDFWPLTTPTLSVVLGVERKPGGSEDGLRDGVVELVAGYLLAGVRPQPLYVVR